MLNTILGPDADGADANWLLTAHNWRIIDAMPEFSDAVIIGGGICGAAVACELAVRGLRVTLLEARSPAGGATGNGFGWINATAKHTEETYHRLNVAAMAHYNQLAERFGAAEMGMKEGGALLWAEEQSEQAAILKAQAERLATWGYPVVRVSSGEMLALEPGLNQEMAEDAVGWFYPADRWLDARRVTHLLLNCAQRHGADIRLYTPALECIRSITGGVSGVRIPDMQIATRVLVIAAGVSTSRLAASLIKAEAPPLPIRGVPGVLVETAAGSAKGAIGRVLYPPDPGGLHMRPTASDGLLLGAVNIDNLLTEAGADASSEAITALLARAARTLPALNIETLARSATARLCVRPFPADGLPLVGELPGVPGAFILTTHSGITLGPYLAALLADRITRSAHSVPELARYSPTRLQDDRPRITDNR